MNAELKFFKSADECFAVIRRYPGCTMEDLHKLGYHSVYIWLKKLTETGRIFHTGTISSGYRYFPND